MIIFFPSHLFESGNYSFIVCNASLEKYLFADPAVTNHFLKIIIDDGICQSTNKIFIPGSFLHERIQIRFHEYSTSVAKFYRAFELRAIQPNSSTIFILSFSACSSRNDPVPAAQTLFISKSTTTPFSILIYFES